MMMERSLLLKAHEHVSSTTPANLGDFLHKTTHFSFCLCSILISNYFTCCTQSYYSFKCNSKALMPDTQLYLASKTYTLKISSLSLSSPSPPAQSLLNFLISTHFKLDILNQLALLFSSVSVEPCVP